MCYTGRCPYESYDGTCHFLFDEIPNDRYCMLTEAEIDDREKAISDLLTPISPDPSSIQYLDEIEKEFDRYIDELDRYDADTEKPA